MKNRKFFLRSILYIKLFGASRRCFCSTLSNRWFDWFTPRVISNIILPP